MRNYDRDLHLQEQRTLAGEAEARTEGEWGEGRAMNYCDRCGRKAELYPGEICLIKDGEGYCQGVIRLDPHDPFPGEPALPPTEQDAERMAWLNDQVKRQQGGR
jgi:hypothetical protein